MGVLFCKRHHLVLEEFHLFDDLYESCKQFVASLLWLLIQLCDGGFDFFHRREFVLHLVPQNVTRHQVNTQVDLNRRNLVPLLLKLVLLRSDRLCENLDNNLGCERGHALRFLSRGAVSNFQAFL